MLIQQIKNYIKNLPGFHTKRKIVVIESDDWGSNRMPSQEAFEALKSRKIINDNNRYDRYDTLAGENDLKMLFEVLNSVRDKNGDPAKITAVSVVANPDYEKIAESGFKEYHYELFTDSLRKRNENNVLELWKQGIEGGYFVPEFHGREHLNVAKWMNALQQGHEATRYAFSKKVYGIVLNDNGNESDSYLAAFDYKVPQEIDELKEILKDGLNQFEKIFGFRSSYFVPPNGPLSSKLHKTLFDLGIMGIQTARLVYNEPAGYGKSVKRIRFFGMRNQFGQIYFHRNVIFEPNEIPQRDWVFTGIKQIEQVFSQNKPAIISSHRVNYIGVFDPSNRDRSINLLHSLLNEIVKRWPDVEFMTSGELLKIIFK